MLVKVGRSEGRRTNVCAGVLVEVVQLRRRLLYTRDDEEDEDGRGRERYGGEYESED